MEEHLVSKRVRDGWSEMNLAMDGELVYTPGISLFPVLSDVCSTCDGFALPTNHEMFFQVYWAPYGP